ncbi:ABC transporter permease [Jatrophihabitans sp.]|uniref:ABC transporter permease n=1 Tax=Jatrophihabitans sp. TaxID=1932789 RepID=UPI002C37AC4C|nr:ABC transporter permease [Jatrophihabitans sp.]
MISDIWNWLSTSEHWHGPDGVPVHLKEHLQYSLAALLIAAAIALPLGMLIGHTGRGSFVVVAIANSFRALPTVGLLTYFVVLISPHIHSTGSATYLIPSEIVLVLLAIPSMLTNTYAGINAVDPAVRDAARGMGMRGGQMLRQVELPNALPLIFSGVRSSFLQVIATATITAYVSLGGLGRYLIDGLAQQDYPQMASGAVLVALLALLADLLLALVQRYTVSRGITGRYSRRRIPDAAEQQALLTARTTA